MPSPQKTKGSGWERAIAAHLSELFGSVFLKTSGSGAYVGGTNASRKQSLDESKIRHFKGDIIPGEDLQLLNIEAKFYQDFPFHQLLTTECKTIDQWISQLLISADPGDINLLAMKFNRKGSFIAFSDSRLTPGLNYIKYAHINSKSTWYICEYYAFWNNNRQIIIDIHQPNTA